MVAGLVAFAIAAVAFAAPTLNVGSKRFTESYILGEILKQTAQLAGETSATHRQGLGNTAIVLNALTTGSIDVYPEYTGTIAKEILKLDGVPSLAELNTRLAPMGLAVGVPLGFNNTYALAMRADDARAGNIARLSDLKAHPDVRLGLSQEFIGRADGWPGLKRTYELPFDTPRGLDHGLAYEAIAGRQVDAIDIYSTDAKLDKYGLTVLEDDRKYFPRYDAVLLYRADLPQRLPKTWAALARLEGTIDDASMRRMNAAAELEGKDFAVVAASFLARQPGTSVSARNVSKGGWARRFLAQALWSRLRPPDARTAGTCLPFARSQHRHWHPARDSRREASGDGRPDHRHDRHRADDSLARPARRPDPADGPHRRGARVHRARLVRAAAHRAQYACCTHADFARNDRGRAIVGHAARRPSCRKSSCPWPRRRSWPASRHRP